MRSTLLEASARSGPSAQLEGIHALLARSGVLLPALAGGLAALVVATGVLWGISQHSLSQAMIVQAETTRHIQEFRQAPVADAWQRLSEVWQRELPRQNALLDRIKGGAGLQSGGFRHFRHFVLETVREQRLQGDIALVVGYFRRLALCVRIGSCDRQAVKTRFGDLPLRFRNQHFLYLDDAYPNQNLDLTFETLSPPRSGAEQPSAG